MYYISDVVIELFVVYGFIDVSVDDIVWVVGIVCRMLFCYYVFKNVIFWGDFSIYFV